MSEQFYTDHTCRVEVKLKNKCFNKREGLFEMRYKGKILQCPNNYVTFNLGFAFDITSLWTIILDINEIKSFTINCKNVYNPYNLEF